jgi:hypothetical protein
MKRPPSPVRSVPSTTQENHHDHETAFDTMIDILRPTKKACRPASSCCTKKKRVTFAFDLSSSNALHPITTTNNGSSEDQETKPHKSLEGYPSMFETLTLEDIERLWYREKDVSNAKELTRSLVLSHLSRNRDTSDSPCILPRVDTTKHISMFGLRKYSYERTQHKRSALWYVLAVSQAYYSTNPEFVHAVSERCTAWARRVAYHEGVALYKSLYGRSLGGTSILEPAASCAHQTAPGAAENVKKDAIITKSTPALSMVSMVTPPASPKHSAGA